MVSRPLNNQLLTSELIFGRRFAYVIVLEETWAADPVWGPASKDLFELFPAQSELGLPLAFTFQRT